MGFLILVGCVLEKGVPHGEIEKSVRSHDLIDRLIDTVKALQRRKTGHGSPSIPFFKRVLHLFNLIHSKSGFILNTLSARRSISSVTLCF